MLTEHTDETTRITFNMKNGRNGTENVPNHYH